MPVSKLGLRRQVVIPKTICDALELEVGDFVEAQQVKGAIVIKPKKLVDREAVLTPEEEKAVRRGKEQIRRGDYVTLETLEHGMESQDRQRGGKTTRKTAS